VTRRPNTVSPAALPETDQPACVLIVDGDKVSQRAIELALAPKKYAIEWARDGEAALDIMSRVRVDIVIADSLLTDMPGISLLRRTAELCGPGAPTFLFVSADRANTTKIGLLLTGASDYLVKPFIPDELRVRVSNAIEARRKLRSETVRGVTGLAGDATQVPIPDILTMLELTRKSGILHVSVGHAMGRIVLEEGRLSHAEVGNLVGADAFFILLQYHGGVYRFEPDATDRRHTIDQRVSEMLLASAVREDSARNERSEANPVLESTITNTAASLRELGIEKRSIDLRSRNTAETKPPPMSELTNRLAIAIADPYLLGDLVLAPEMATAHGQFRVELWSAQSEGVSALLALASPPGFQVLAAALGEERQRLHLQFETLNATVIVTLVDLESDLDLPEAPVNGVILVPPRGELVALPPHRLADISSRIDQAQKPVIVALGGPALHATLGRIMEEADRGFRFLALPPKLDDLRDVLGGVIRLWNASR
jgi:CheY-like chemotaxis protein